MLKYHRHPAECINGSPIIALPVNAMMLSAQELEERTLPHTSFTSLRQSVTKRDHSQGREDAAITLVKYGDFESPACGAAYWIVKELQQRLTVRFRFVFRSFPETQTYPHAQLAAEAAEAAAAQGKFWQMHGYLYMRQPLRDEDALIQYAALLNLDTDRFKDELQTHRYADQVAANLKSGEDNGITKTPAFFVNGIKYSGDIDQLAIALR